MESPLEQFLEQAFNEFQNVRAKDRNEAPTHRHYRLLGAKQFMQFLQGKTMVKDEPTKLKRRRSR
jgi:hypothetical protein